jgi:hypothetical protein
MPSAEPSNITRIIETVIKLKPKSILDIGVGVGKYGLLFRDYLDSHWVHHAFHDPKTWTLELIGIEVFEKYLTPVQRYIYNNIWIGDAYKLLKGTAGCHQFDLVFMGDVIEHFTKEEGRNLIECIRDNWLTEHGHIIISTPNFQTRINDPARVIFGNQNEIHKCRWYAQEFREFGMKHNIIEERLLTVILTR